MRHVPACMQVLTTTPHALPHRYGPDEACAMCLLSAISQPALSQPALQAQLAEWARRWGEGASSAMAAGQGGAPNVAQTAAAHGQAVLLAEKRYSGRHGGLCRVLARLLQPYWDRPLILKVPEPSNATGEDLRLCEPRERWNELQGKLLCLINHIETHGEAWGRLGAAGYAGTNPRASLGGGGAVGMHQLGQGLLADPNVPQALRHAFPPALRLGAVVSQDEADLKKQEAAAIEALF